MAMKAPPGWYDISFPMSEDEGFWQEMIGAGA